MLIASSEGDRSTSVHMDAGQGSCVLILLQGSWSQCLSDSFLVKI